MVLASHNRTWIRLALANQHADGNEGQIASPEAMLAPGSNEDNDGDYEDVEGPRVEAHVCLARMRRKLLWLSYDTSCFS